MKHNVWIESEYPVGYSDFEDDDTWWHYDRHETRVATFVVAAYFGVDEHDYEALNWIESLVVENGWDADNLILRLKYLGGWVPKRDPKVIKGEIRREFALAEASANRTKRWQMNRDFQRKAK